MASKSSFRGRMPVPVFMPESLAHPILVTSAATSSWPLEADTSVTTSAVSNENYSPEESPASGQHNTSQDSGNHSPRRGKSRLSVIKGLIAATAVIAGALIGTAYFSSQQSSNSGQGVNANASVAPSEKSGAVVLTVNGKLKVEKEAEIGELKVTRSANFGGDAVVQGALVVAGQASIAGNLKVSGELQADSLRGNFTGDGSQLSNVNANTLAGNDAEFYGNADNLTEGTIADARLSKNVALLDGNNTFSGASAFTQSVTLQGGLIGTAGSFSSTVAAIAFTQNGNTVCDSSNNCGFSTSSNAFTQGGNSFGTTAILGTNDSYGLAFRTNGLSRLAIASSGEVTVQGSLAASSFSGNGAGLTAVDAASLQGTSLSISGLSSGHYLRYNGTAWVNDVIKVADLPGGSTSYIWNGTAQQTGNINISSASSASVGLLISGATSQSANLQEWRQAGGSFGSAVDPFGNLFIRTPSRFSTAAVSVLTPSTSGQGIVVRGFSSQTANLQEWQDNSGGILASVTSNGGVRGHTFKDNRMATSSAQFAIQSQDAGTVTSILRGFTSQTADLTQWQNSSGTALAVINSSGSFYTNVRMGAGNASGALANSTGGSAVISSTIGTATDSGLVIKGAASQTADLLQLQDSTGAVLSKFNASGNLTLNSNLNFSNAATLTLATSTSALNIASSLITLDTVNSRVNIGTAGLAAKLSVSSGISPNVLINPSGASATGLIVKGASAQSASLQEWQDSSGGVAAKITSTGEGVFYAALNAGSWLGGARLAVDTASAGTIGIRVRAAASQSADLQQWQDSAGTVMSRINQFGGFATANRVTVGSSSISSSALLHVNTTGASNVGALVRGAASQTADLMQWQDSSSNVLTRITSAGHLGVNASATTSQLAVVTDSTSTIGLIVKGITSQTGDLLQLQGATGTVVASVDASGNLSAKNTTVNGTANITATAQALHMGDDTNLTTYANFTNRGYVGYDSGGFAVVQGGVSKGVKLNVNSSGFGQGTAMMIDTSGNVGIGATSNLTQKLNINGTVGTLSEGDIFSQYDGFTSSWYPLLARYWDNNATYQSGTYLFANGTNGYVGIEKPGGGSIHHIQVKALNSIFYGNVTLNGHIITGNTSGSTTVAAGAAACTTPTVSITGNDTSGMVSITTGTSCSSSGVLATTTFASAFGSTPNVVLTPGNAAAAGLQYYVDPSTTAMSINTNTAPANATLYKYYYHVMQ